MSYWLLQDLRGSWCQLLWKANSQQPIANSLYNHGAEGDRTPDLLIANEALSQLSYSPKVASRSAMKDEKSTGRGPTSQQSRAHIPQFRSGPAAPQAVL